jgi:hypothetical protein
MSQSVSRELKLHNELRISEHSDGAVILDVQRGQVFSANAMGARILVFLQENKNLDQIADQISKEFRAPRELVCADVQKFVDSLRSSGLTQA